LAEAESNVPITRILAEFVQIVHTTHWPSTATLAGFVSFGALFHAPFFHRKSVICWKFVGVVAVEG
jgi:hypothetical protein